MVDLDLVSVGFFCFIPLLKDSVGATVNKLVVRACVSGCCTLVPFNTSMNVHKGRCSCHETLTGDTMRLLGETAARDIVVVSAMPIMRSWEMLGSVGFMPCVQFPFSLGFIYTSYFMVAAT